VDHCTPQHNWFSEGGFVAVA